MNRYLVFAAMVGLAPGCGDTNEQDKGTDAPPLDTSGPDDTGDDGCGGTPPVASFTADCEYPGLQEHEQYDDPVPTMLFMIKVEDADKDLDVVQLNLYIEEGGDGVIDASTADELVGTPGAVQGGEECNTDEANFAQTLFLPPNSVDNGELYDWGAVAFDHSGMASEMAVIVCYAPNEDGTKPSGDTGG